LEFVVGTPEDAKKDIEIIGPFARGDYYYLSVNGCRAPYVRLFKNQPQNEWEAQFEWYLILDERWGCFAHEEEIYRWGSILANGMAVSAGFTYCGPDSKPLNRFSTKLIGLDSLPED
jgi:hypothetical protein